MADIAVALRELVASDEDLESVLRRHFSPDYRQRTNGTWSDRRRFADHIRHLRSITADLHVEVLDELADGDRYADRHVVTVTKRDGSTVVQEVYVFARLDATGRFRVLEEVTMMLAGAEADRDIGGAAS